MNIHLFHTIYVFRIFHGLFSFFPFYLFICLCAKFQMLNLCYVYYLSKLTEFADTIFFVLKKKKSQQTWLHLYHHSLTPLEAWILVKFLSGEFDSDAGPAINWNWKSILIAGGNATFPNILNNFVHVCMYFYYMMSAMGPQYQKYLWWKKYMTELQIVSRFFSSYLLGDISRY